MVKSAHLLKPHYTTINPQGFDVAVCDDKKQIYAVFDGVGISPGARKAAEKCAELVGFRAKGGEDWQMLRAILTDCIATVRSFGDPQAGCTATIASIDFNGHLHYAHVGDSRLYALQKDGGINRLRQVTADEGVGNMLLNYVGPASVGVCQAGTLYDNWSKFMLCTDGITGDWPPAILTDFDIENIITAAASVQDAARLIMQASKKADDKTVIVVGR